MMVVLIWVMVMVMLAEGEVLSLMHVMKQV